MWLQKQKNKKNIWEGALPCARTITHGKEGGFAVCYGHNTRQTSLPGRTCEEGLPCACMVAHGKDSKFAVCLHGSTRQALFSGKTKKLL